MIRFFLLISLSLSFYPNHIQADFVGYAEDGKETQTEKKKHKENEIMKIQSLTQTEKIVISHDQVYIIRPKLKIDDKIMKILKELKEAEECLDALVKERQIRVGDFWGINVTARRYDNVFDPRNYIRYKIMQVDKKIEATKLRICELRKKLDRLTKSHLEKQRNK